MSEAFSLPTDPPPQQAEYGLAGGPDSTPNTPAAPTDSAFASPLQPEPLAQPTRDERILGMLAHVLQIVSWFIAPLIIFFARRDSRFVRYHALQAVFFQLLAVLVWGAALVAIFAGAFAAAFRHGGEASYGALGFPILFFLVFWVGGALTWLLNFVLAIVYGLRAHNGEWAGYPGLKYLAAKVAGVELPY